jgi:UDP-glucose 4-epimerase
VIVLRWSSKTVLITGGAGFIGKNLAAKLLNENVKVFILDDFSYAPRSKVMKGAELIIADVSNSLQFNGSLSNKDIDFIFHFAAPSSVVLFNRDPVKCFNKTVAGILNVFYYAREKDVQKVIFPSSGSVYGELPPPQSEDQNPRPVNLYGIAKLTTEYIAQYFAEHVKYLILRIFAGYGPGEEHKGDYASPVTLFLDSIVNNKPPIIYGDGSQSRDFVYVDDVVNAVLRSAESSFSRGVINVGSGHSHTFNEAVSMINELLGKEIRPKYVKKPEFYLEKTCADIRRMKEILSLDPLDLYDGLKKYLESSSKI